MAVSRVVSEIFNVEKSVVLSRTVSQINVISVENRNFSTPVYFVPPLKLFPLKLGTGALCQKNWNDGATGNIFNRLDTIHQRDGRTDGQTQRRTDIGRQQRSPLRVASRGKMGEHQTSEER